MLCSPLSFLAGDRRPSIENSFLLVPVLVGIVQGNVLYLCFSRYSTGKGIVSAAWFLPAQMIYGIVIVA